MRFRKNTFKYMYAINQTVFGFFCHCLGCRHWRHCLQSLFSEHFCFLVTLSSCITAPWFIWISQMVFKGLSILSTMDWSSSMRARVWATVSTVLMHLGSGWVLMMKALLTQLLLTSSSPVPLCKSRCRLGSFASDGLLSNNFLASCQVPSKRTKK